MDREESEEQSSAKHCEKRREYGVEGKVKLWVVWGSKDFAENEDAGMGLFRGGNNKIVIDFFF